MPKRLPRLDQRPERPRPEGRPSPSRRGYGRTWHKIRAAVLAESPLCEDCAERGIVEAATEVDHILALSKGGDNRRENLRPLCKPCHSRKTVAVDGGLAMG